MAFTITRRDFLNGVSLAVAAGLAPADQLRAETQHPYPPLLQGLRGSHPGSFETAHKMGLEGKAFGTEGESVDAPYDLVVVGGGISGLSAAWFYREAFGPEARILILENHDDFGGHAKRNEFDLADGSKLVGYGGSEALESPKANLSEAANYLLATLGVDLAAFETAFDRNLYKSLGLTDSVFFDKENFGQDRLCPGMPGLSGTDQDPGMSAKAKNFDEFLATTPLSPEARQQLARLFSEPRDYLLGRSASESAEYLQTTSYRQYLMNDAGLGEEAVKFFQQQTHDYFALGIESVSAYDAMLSGYAGFSGLSFDDENPDEPEEPYIYHFPDGNASIARLLVRSLIPSAASGNSMQDIVTAAFDYSKLDLLTSRVRLRLNATAVAVANDKDMVRLSYVRNGRQEQVSARHAVLACYNMVIPHIMPELPDAQKALLAKNVKAPLVYVSVVVRNWTSFVTLGTHNIYAPTAFYSTVKLDYPVAMGDYHNPHDPEKPIILHLVHVPVQPGPGLSDIEQHRQGRRRLLQMTFEDFEREIIDQLNRMLGPGGFDAERDIAAITVNRWPHGYAYYANSLFAPPGHSLEPDPAAILPAGNVTIANSDAGWNAFAHEAIDQAFRAVGELVGME
jgi:spermidine dehydrogenase